MTAQDNQKQASEFDDKAAAYFFAGEGYLNIAIPNVKQKWYPSLRVGITTSEVLWSKLLFARYGGFTWCATPKKQTNRFLFGWRVTGKQAEAFLRAIQPHLKGEKVPQLELALRFRDEARKYYRKGKINTQIDLWKQYMDELKTIRCAAAETNRKDAELNRRSDSPTLQVTGE